MHESKPVVPNLRSIWELPTKLPKNKDASELMIYIYLGHSNSLEAGTPQWQWAHLAPRPWFLNTTSPTKRNKSPLEKHSPSENLPWRFRFGERKSPNVRLRHLAVARTCSKSSGATPKGRRSWLEGTSGQNWEQSEQQKYDNSDGLYIIHWIKKRIHWNVRRIKRIAFLYRKTQGNKYKNEFKESIILQSPARNNKAKTMDGF